MVNLDRELRVALRTGKVVFGSKEVLKLAGRGKGKLLIVSSNCPEYVREQLEYYAKLAGIPIYRAPYTGIELGEICQRKHVISSLLILEEGESEVLKLVEQ